MKMVRLIAVATFREALRARVFLYLLVVAAAMVVASVPAAELGIGGQTRLIMNLSLSGTEFVAVFLALFLGVSAVSGEIDRRTVYTVISKLPSRTDFVLGKFAGVWATVTCAVVISYCALALVLAVQSKRWTSELVPSLLMEIFEMGLLIALATFFSCISKPLLSSGVALALYIAGSSASSLQYWVDKVTSDELTRTTSKVLFWLLPDFEVFDVTKETLYHLQVDGMRLALACGYGLLYSGLLLGAASFVFARRDLK